jgi:hypothetical protein
VGLVKDEDLLSFLQISQIPTEVVDPNQCSDTQLLNVPCRYCYFDQLKGNLEMRQSGPGNAGVPNIARHGNLLDSPFPSSLNSKISHARYVGI